MKIWPNIYYTFLIWVSNVHILLENCISSKWKKKRQKYTYISDYSRYIKLGWITRKINITFGSIAHVRYRSRHRHLILQLIYRLFWFFLSLYRPSYQVSFSRDSHETTNKFCFTLIQWCDFNQKWCINRYHDLRIPLHITHIYYYHYHY